MSTKAKKKDKKGGGGENLSPAPTLSRRSRHGLILGVILLLIGFSVLSLADARAQNWAGHLAPLILVLGYTVIGVSLVLKDPPSTLPPQS